MLKDKQCDKKTTQRGEAHGKNCTDTAKSVVVWGKSYLRNNPEGSNHAV